MSVRGSNTRLPLDCVRTQPFVSPKIELSNQRTERVDVRVLPVIFRVRKAQNINLYPGECIFAVQAQLNRLFPSRFD